MTTNQQSKRVLMFCAGFFGYEKRIADAIRSQGHAVDLYDERPNSGFVAKACIRYNIGLYQSAIRKYYKRLIEKGNNNPYDYVLVVKGEAVTEEIVKMLRAGYPNAKFVLYLWDSVANTPDCVNRMKLYDQVFTFDPEDAKKYQIEYLPIPYDEDSFSYTTCDTYKYDAAFIGTAHSVRPRVVKQIQQICRQQNRTMFVYFYSPHILVYLFNKLTNPDYKWITRKDVNFKPLSSAQVYEIYANSRCVLDIEHPKQSGATTRPIEMLAMKKKIISTNRHVVEFPFYNDSNFCVVQRDAVEIDRDFWERPYIDVDDDIMQRYSPERFAQMLIGE